jgi:hypothetical protein
MPNYVSSPFKATPKLLTPNTPTYVWGSFNDLTGPTQGVVLQSLGIGATAELVVKILSGNIPVVGSLISVVGVSANASFNVTNAALTAVDRYPHGNEPDNGIYALAYAATVTSPIQSDSGQFLVPQPEVGELVSGTGASVPVAVNAWNVSGKSLSVTLTLGTGLSGVTAVLQGANRDIDAEYNTIGTIGSGLGVGTTDWQSGQGDTATGTLAAGSVNFPNFRFYRLNLTAVTGSGLVIAKIMD